MFLSGLLEKLKGSIGCWMMKFEDANTVAPILCVSARLLCLWGPKCVPSPCVSITVLIIPTSFIVLCPLMIHVMGECDLQLVWVDIKSTTVCDHCQQKIGIKSDVHGEALHWGWDGIWLGILMHNLVDFTSTCFQMYSSGKFVFVFVPSFHY